MTQAAAFLESPPSPAPNFSFAFNNDGFSDRILRIKIFPDIPSSQSAGGNAPAVDSDSVNDRKRRRIDSGVVAVVQCNEQQRENQDEDVVAITQISELPSETLGNYVNDKVGGSNAVILSTVPRIETMHISSAILVAKSPVFHKMVTKGIKQSELEKPEVNLEIHESEEEPFKDLLYFIYNNTLPVKTASSLLGILKTSDKFEVESCMRYCSRLLERIPMTRDSALLYLELPSSVRMVAAVQSLSNTAKNFLAELYREPAKFKDEVLNLPLAGIEAVLSSDALHVATEDSIFNLVLEWARSQHPNDADKRKYVTSRLAPLIRFPFMTSRKLREVLSCPDVDPLLAKHKVIEALLHKCVTPYVLPLRPVERSYMFWEAKVVKFELSHPQCILYLDLKRQAFADMFPAGFVSSWVVPLGGADFSLGLYCRKDKQNQNSPHFLGMDLCVRGDTLASFIVDYEFLVMAKPGEDFLSRYKGTLTFPVGSVQKVAVNRNLLGTPWATFMSDESIYFINSVLHLQAKLIVRKIPPVPCTV